MCQYGGLRNHLPILILGTIALTLTSLLWLISKRYKYEVVSNSSRRTILFRVEIIVFILATLYFGGRMIYSAIPYNGALSWEIDELLRKKEIKLVHNNFFNDGVEGVLLDLDNALHLPDELFIVNKYQMTFDESGTIQSIYAFLYGKDEKGETRTYLVDYHTEKDENISVWVDGAANTNYDGNMRLAPMLAILEQADCERQVTAWAQNDKQGPYEILYMGSRSFQTEEAKNKNTWTVDKSDETMYFFLNDEKGWRLVVTDAAAGSRFYVMEKTENGGSKWEYINTDPFAGTIGVTQGLIFIDDNIGFALLVGASQSHSQLYVSRDGGITFEAIQLPMDKVTQLPESAEEYDYMHMPKKEGSLLEIQVTTEATESNGLLFQSNDNGNTWEYEGLTQ